MNTSTDRINLSRFIENSQLFFTLLSVTMLALIIGISFLNPCTITSYFPYVALVSVLLAARFKTVGISVAYGMLAFYLVYFYPSITPSARLWEMGLIFTTALTSFIFLLSFEEMEALSSTLSKNLDEKDKQLTTTAGQLGQLEQSYKEQYAELEQEIQKLKNEASIRILERQQDQRTIELITSEIELLTNQKQEILASAARAYEQASKAELVEVHLEPLSDKSQTSYQLPVDVSAETLELKRKLTRVEGLYKQLRTQFDEKANVLLATRKELFKVEGQLEVDEREKYLASLELEESLEKDFAILAEENQMLEEEISNLEEIISQLTGPMAMD